MSKYQVMLSPTAYKDLENIYQYISTELFAGNSAERIVSEIENAIFSLDVFPYRGSERKTGIFANKGYRQLFVHKYTIVYRIEEDSQQVIILTIRYTPSNF